VKILRFLKNIFSGNKNNKTQKIPRQLSFLNLIKKSVEKHKKSVKKHK